MADLVSGAKDERLRTGFCDNFVSEVEDVLTTGCGRRQIAIDDSDLIVVARSEALRMLDATRSASIFGRLLSGQSAALGTAAAVLGPLVGAVQLGRGYFDLTTGVKSQTKSLQVQGLADMASAVGLTMATTGIGTIPGIAIASVAIGAKGLYTAHSGFRDWVDGRLEKSAPNLERATRRIDEWLEPAIDTARPLVEKWLGRKGRQAEDATVTHP